MKKIEKLKFINKLELSLKHNLNLINVIIGPRQVGKTTTIQWFLENEFPNQYSYYSADGLFNEGAEWVQKVWQLALIENKILIIDEIQKIENWSEILKKFWDLNKKNKKELRLIVLGSSSLHIQKGLTESLTGRFILHRAYHWNFQESSNSYNISFEEYLKVGGYPASYEFKDKQIWLNYVKNSIVNTVIEKDILLYQKVKSPSLFKQAFEIITSYPAQEISYTKLLGQLQDKGNVDLIKYYLSLYEGAFLIKVLEKFSAKKIITKASSPKILPLAPAFYYIHVQNEYDSTERGHVFEILVGHALLRTENSLYYWRDGKHEVDYVLTIGKKIFAIEVKSGRKKSSQGLSVFCKTFKNAKSIIITPESYIEFEKNPVEFLDSFSI